MWILALTQAVFLFLAGDLVFALFAALGFAAFLRAGALARELTRAKARIAALEQAAGIASPRAEYNTKSPEDGLSVRAPRRLRRGRPLAPILSAAALSVCFASTLAAYAGFHRLPAGLAFALMAVSALGAILAGLRFGEPLAAAGLIGAYLAPGLVHFSQPASAALFGYLLALTAAALAIVRGRKWRGFLWLACAGALAWGWAWMYDVTPQAGDAVWYIAALVPLGLAFGWSDAGAPLELTSLRALRVSSTEPVRTAYFITLAVGVDLFVLAQYYGYAAPLLIAALAFCAVSAIAAHQREGFALAPFAGAALAAALILSWPTAAADGGYLLAPSLFFALCGAFGFIFSASGWLIMMAHRGSPTGASLAALAPLAIILVSYLRASALRPPLDWAGAALALAAVDAFALHRIGKALAQAPGPRGAFALGAASGIVLALWFSLADLPLALACALAMVAPALALADLRLRLPILRFATALIAALTIWLSGPNLGDLFPPEARSLPGLAVYAFDVAALWGAGAVYRHAGLSEKTSVRRILEAGALMVAVLGVSLAIRTAADGGVRARGFSLGELSADAIAYVALALAIGAHAGPKPRTVLYGAELLAFAGAVAAVLIGPALLLNPWWGWFPAPIAGPPIADGILAAFGAPALLFAAYALLSRRLGAPLRALISGAAAMVLTFVVVTLEMRRLFAGDAMNDAPVGPWEAWTTTAAWLALAAALLVLGLIRRQPSLRYASFIVLLAAITKALGFDVHALNGTLLAAQLIGLVLAVLAVTFIYQRFVAARALRGDPNLIPPR